MVALRIFSYLPNPRVWKATIAARLCDVEIEVRGASPPELSKWLWDFEARPMAEVPPDVLDAAERTGRIGFADRTLYKTAAFLETQPFGTVPAAFSPDGRTGIFESNSIMRAVARLGQERFPLYGRSLYESSRIDDFLDVSLAFARDGQIYLLALRDGAVSRELYARVKDSFVTYLAGIEQALAPQRSFLVGDNITLADICFIAELCLFHNERAPPIDARRGGISSSARRRVRRDVSSIGESFPAAAVASGFCAGRGWLPRKNREEPRPERIARAGETSMASLGQSNRKGGVPWPIVTPEKDAAVGAVTVAKLPHIPG
jgi:elongation factor 1-gamma